MKAPNLDVPFTTTESLRELSSMSAATINRYLAPMWTRFELKGKSATEPGLLLRNSISTRRAGDELADVPGLLECDSPRSLRSNVGG